tara:strand:- start:555 stop:815 length:261 start_codon:yes stop_codon:yes gene_type:complete
MLRMLPLQKEAVVLVEGAEEDVELGGTRNPRKLLPTTTPAAEAAHPAAVHPRAVHPRAVHPAALQSSNDETMRSAHTWNILCQPRG